MAKGCNAVYIDLWFNQIKPIKHHWTERNSFKWKSLKVSNEFAFLVTKFELKPYNLLFWQRICRSNFTIE